MRNAIVITSASCGAQLRDFLLLQNPQMDVRPVSTLGEIDAAILRTAGKLRLISFLSRTIIPERIINALQLTPYNVHPGPPEYPGSLPETFAIADGARQFGATGHVMAAKVDTGPIVAVQRFPMPPSPTVDRLSQLAFLSALQVFADIACACAHSDDDILPLAEQWRGPARRAREAEGLLPARRA